MFVRIRTLFCALSVIHGRTLHVVVLQRLPFKYYLDFPDVGWTCSWCNLPFAAANHLFEIEVDTQVNTLSTCLATEGFEDFEDELYGNEVLPNPQESSIVEERKNNSHSAFVAHLNINSIQNKSEELKLLNDSLKTQIFIVSGRNQN